MTNLVFEDYPQGYIVSYLYKLSRALSLSRMLAEFFFQNFTFHHVQENFSIYEAHIPGKCIDSRHFTGSPCPFTHKFLSSHSRQKKITYSPRNFENLFPPKRGEENQNLLYQNSVRKYKDDLKHQIFYILYGLQFFQM